MTAVNNNPLFDLQQTLYQSSNYTRRRLHCTRRLWVTKAIATYAPTAPVATALEYGPGSGIYLPVLAQHCAEVMAADVEQNYLAGIQPLLEQHPQITLFVDDIQDSTLTDRSIDLVLCSEVLEHVRDPERALRTIYRILRPGGVAIVTTPQRFSVMEVCCKGAFLPGVIQVVRAIYREPILETGHISLRTCGEIGVYLNDCGFEILEQRRFGLYVPLVAEFGGRPGGRLIEWVEARLGDSIFDQLLWTQAYVLRRPVAS